MKTNNYERDISFYNKLYSKQLGFVYIIKCWNDKNNPFYYVGQTNNLFQRMGQHFNNKNTSISKYRNKELVYFEIHENYVNTLIRERELGNLSLKEKLLLIESIDGEREKILLINSINERFNNKLVEKKDNFLEKNIRKTYFFIKIGKSKEVIIPKQIWDKLKLKEGELIKVNIRKTRENKKKQINVYFEDSEFEKLIKYKDDLSWHDFILKLVEFMEKTIKEK
ncbi:hypothetical protein ES702_02603 [subsurface metagenome]